MTEKNDTQTDTDDVPAEATQPQAMQVNIRMQQGEHTGQPIYSNFTAVQGVQGVVLVDFGFLEPQAMNALARMAKSGEKTLDTVSARMSCRLAISVEAANDLIRQLDQLLHSKADTGTQAAQKSQTQTAGSTLQ